jgi:hypothetical protein
MISDFSLVGLKPISICVLVCFETSGSMDGIQQIDETG